LINHAATGVAAFDCGTQSVITYAAQYEALRYMEKIGVANIRAHANRLIGRLQKELPPLGYTSITPQGTQSSIVTFLCKDAEVVRKKIRASKAKILLTGPNSALTVGRFGNHIRFSVSVFNNDQDINTILEVLA
jgi:selenocysteine lyase/cysteine desulfurase